MLLVLTEKGSIRIKIEAVKRLIQNILNGEKQSPMMLMMVIRFVMPAQDHTIKKLLLIFWEVVPKYTADGKMMQEMILVCDAYRKVRSLLGPSSYHISILVCDAYRKVRSLLGPSSYIDPCLWCLPYHIEVYPLYFLI